MLRRRIVCLPIAFLSMAACKTNQGNGEAKPENSGNGYNPDNQKNNMRQSGTGGPGKSTTPSQPARSQTAGQPAGKTD
jgi:hypothetical protein